MKLNAEDALEMRGYLRGKGLTIEQAAALVDCHRTTISKKLSGASEITPCDLLEIGEKIGRHTVRHSGGI